MNGPLFLYWTRRQAPERAAPAVPSIVFHLRYRPMSQAAVVFIAITAAFMGLMANAFAAEQDYPSKRIRILSSTAPGGIIDSLARVFAQKLQERTGQVAVVENAPVAVGTVGVAQAAKWIPDGYSLLIAHAANMSISPLLNPQLAYVPQRDFTPVALFGRASNLLLVPKDSPIQSAQELISEAKAKPGALTYASQGIGSTAHMATEQFKQIAGVDLLHVPYRGAAPATNALLAGQVSMMIDTVPGNLAHVRAGNVRALAVSGTRRSALLPGIPTLQEAGIPGIEGGLWVGLFVPVNTPMSIVTYLNKQANEIFTTPEVRENFDRQGVVFVPNSPQDFTRFLTSENTRWRDVIKHGNIKLQD